MSDQFLFRLATAIFAIAVVHTLFTNSFLKLSKKFKPGSISENLLHFLGEVETVFAFWTLVFGIVVSFTNGPGQFVQFFKDTNFSEVLFIFAMMVVASTRPVLSAVERCIFSFASLFSQSLEPYAVYFSLLALVPLLGSFVTEPVAMTVAALILGRTFFASSQHLPFKYATLAALFVLISIGGCLTPYAAPPIVVVAQTWNWGMKTTFMELGIPSVLATAVVTCVLTYAFRREIASSFRKSALAEVRTTPFWMTLSHLIFMTLIVIFHAYPIFVIGFFLVFLGWYRVTAEHQSALKLSQAILVAAFLGGLIFLGNFQKWWIEPLINGASDHLLYFGSMSLTAVVDNAALTYLASLVPGLSESSKIAIVSGALAGGGLTLIANAPNPIGFGILKKYFGDEGVSPIKLFIYALFPTAVASACFYLFS